jgi:hypothetical protein
MLCSRDIQWRSTNVKLTEKGFTVTGGIQNTLCGRDIRWKADYKICFAVGIYGDIAPT